MKIKYLIFYLNLICPLYVISQNVINASEKIAPKKTNKYDTIFSIKNDTFISYKVYRHSNNYLVSVANLKLSKSTIYPPEILININNVINSVVYSSVKLFYLPKVYQTGEIEYYDTNHKKSIVMNIENGYLNGKWLQYYNNGNIMIEGYYEGHAKSGIWKWYYDSGVLLKKGEFLSNVNIYSLNIRNEEIICDKYTKYYKLDMQLNKDSVIKEIKKIINNYNALISLPYIINYRNGIWEIWNNEGILVSKKTYFNTPCNIDIPFDNMNLR